MTPKEKAIELFNKFNFDIRPFSELGYWDRDAAKKCALIAVDEIIEVLELVEYSKVIALRYWYALVKQEIEKL